jgi:hypothetical protein
MDNLTIQKKVHELIESTHADLLQLIDSLSTKEKDARGSLKSWSAKDLVTHLNFWGQHFINQLEKFAKGEKVPLAGDYFDQVNDGVLYEHMDQALGDALAEYEKIHAQLMTIYATLTAEELSDTKKYAWLEGRPMSDRMLDNLVWHPQSHIADFYVKRGQLEKATALQEILTEKSKEFPTWATSTIYNIACFYALNGFPAKAIANLKIAFAQRPDLVTWSKQDSDLDALRELADFKDLFPTQM